jgi:NAD(P)-dependent dehydrogenase (short-subunit alcohol dehydrogenase family)
MIERTSGLNRFKDKVAIVTGGVNGIGRAIVEELCKEGCSVAILDVSDDCSAAESELLEQGWDVMVCQGDVADETFCKAVVGATLDKWGKVNHLVNNAFSFTAKGLDAVREDWERSLMVGPVGYAVMMQQCAKPMKSQGGGSVVNVSSISAFIAQPNRWTYNASKGAVHTLTKCMAYDLAPFNIRVNSISPGWIWTREVDKAANLDGGGREKWEPIWGRFHMLRRCGDPIECAHPTLFLLSDDASFITGTDLAVCGGYQAMGPEGLGDMTMIAGTE